jgi:hypothetical protein
MFTNTTAVFPSTRIDMDFVQMMTEEGNANGYTTPAPEHCSFTLIANRLVPETFIQAVQMQLKDYVFDYGCVLSQEYMFNTEFLAVLDADQLAVLMPTVLLLAARGTLPLNLWSDELETI